MKKGSTLIDTDASANSSIEGRSRRYSARHQPEAPVSDSESQRFLVVCLLVMGVVATARGQFGANVQAMATPTNRPTPLTVLFRARGTATRSTPSDWQEYTWNFGDGTTANVAVVTHTYPRPGSYTSTVTYARQINIPDSPTLRATQKLIVTVSLPPALTVTPPNLEFRGQAGSSNPAPQFLTVSNSGGGRLLWSASNDSTNWLKLSQNSGLLIGGGGTQLEARVLSSTLTTGTYSARIVFSSRESVNNSVVAKANLILSALPTRVEPEPVHVPHSNHRLIYYLLAAILAGLAIAFWLGGSRGGKPKSRPKPQTTTFRVKAILDPGRQKVQADKTIVAPCLRIRIKWDIGKLTLKPKARLVGNITKLRGKP